MSSPREVPQVWAGPREAVVGRWWGLFSRFDIIPFPKPLESAIAVGYVFQFSGRSRDGLEDHAELHLRVRG